MTWYYPKGWTDQEDGVEQVVIHYACTPPEQWPDWAWGHESRVLEDRGGFPRNRLKVLRMPRDVWDMQNGWSTPEYRFHYYFEVFQNGHRWTTDLLQRGHRLPRPRVRRPPRLDDEHLHLLVGGRLVRAGLQPDGGPPLPGRLRLPGHEVLLVPGQGALPPREVLDAAGRWSGRTGGRSRMYGPRGATLVQQYHVGRMYPPEEKDEFWLGPDGRAAPGRQLLGAPPVEPGRRPSEDARSPVSSLTAAVPTPPGRTTSTCSALRKHVDRSGCRGSRWCSCTTRGRRPARSRTGKRPTPGCSPQ